MSEPRILRFYLEKNLRDSAVAGEHNFIGLIAKAAESSGYRTEYRPNNRVERLKSAARRGYAIFHMDDPFHDRALTIRRAYHYPFWAMESSAKRWEWRVATTPYLPNDALCSAAEAFYRYWQGRLFGPATLTPSREGFVYIPLQGKLLEQRSFQSCSPLEMIGEILRHDPDRGIKAALHPKETYSNAEMKALTELAAQHPRLEIATEGMEKLLRGCDYVATQNSSAGFAGYFFGKPCVLFAQSDFHHIAARADVQDVAEAVSATPHMAPDYAGYIHWFWQVMSINAGCPDAKRQILDAFSRAGWPT